MIGEYSAKKIYFFNGRRKNYENFPHFHFQKWKILKIALFWEKLSRLAFFGGKLQKFANLGVKIEENRVKSIKTCTFLGNSFPHTYSFQPPVLLFGRIFTIGLGGSGPFM